MKGTFEQIKALVTRGAVQISEHGYDELAVDDLSVREAVAGLSSAELLEDYPDYSKGPTVLVLERDLNDHPFHAVWGIAKGTESPAVLITAYRPDPARWVEGYRRRKR